MGAGSRGFRKAWAGLLAVAGLLSGSVSFGQGPPATPETGRLKVRLSWGQRARAVGDWQVEARAQGMKLARMDGWELEAGDSLREGVARTRAGGGDTDGIDCLLEYPARTVTPVQDLPPTWRDLIAAADEDTARRLRADPAIRPDDRRLAVRLGPDGGRGFTLTIDQLLSHRAFWVPALDVYVAVGDNPASFDRHQEELRAWTGRRVLDRVHAGAETTLAEYTARWEDMGSPSYRHPAQPAPGHVVTLAWDGSLAKFGVDPGAGVWSDLGTSPPFRFHFDFGRRSPELAAGWRGQRLTDGLPVIVTTVERDGVRYEVEQFATPLHGPPADRRGDIPVVLLQRLRLTNLGDGPRDVTVRMSYERPWKDGAAPRLASPRAGTFLYEDGDGRAALLAIQGEELEVKLGPPAGPTPKPGSMRAQELTASVRLPGRETRDLVVKLPSPGQPPGGHAALLGLDYPAARTATLRYWNERLDQGTRFVVPEAAVNELFRANLWHALRLPRRHGVPGENTRLDLPYSNFAYGQDGIPWPVNQAVYVDSLLYDLRGHHGLAAEELLAIYRAVQEPNGHVKGYANWVVYTPGMVYASARHYLLSGDRVAFDRLLPPTLRAADWCLAEIRKAGPQGGLVAGPLNDLTGDGVWAFSQAYLYAGLDLLGRALDRAGHPRAAEMRRAAGDLRKAIERGFGTAAVRSPLVQLADHTWTPYVPCEARSTGRRFDQWYPTDVDTGAMHLPRLRALDPGGLLTECLLHDHEDNLYLKGWGMANEPVYNPQATVYLLRDDARAAIRAFYSMTACAFSHGAREPVEHRWTHGQFFGPPSTDGAWFELYRQMLVLERDDDSLVLLAATPRPWLADGRRIDVRQAPTYHGSLSVVVDSRAASGTIRAEVTTPLRAPPRELLVRLRHPEGKRIRSVTVNGQPWTDFDPAKEWVRIARPEKPRYEVIAAY